MKWRIDDDWSQSSPSSIMEDNDRSLYRKKRLRGVAGASPEMRGDSVFDEGDEECLVCRIRDVWLYG
ncbi:cyclic nucleotide-gated ion channel 1-like [Pyrus ussuriensis x Pyrus communis]|uniref:Cyclic nucleotide-gated ion channel 1-like n=1 Tax=Pyrus ussuriensis x Pyrus communis TaxID=2448454 RepID=A0A5N5FV59_9ROSA|nr:cyclic nucleotide-gated ion channel 1-like [Pyrus ussuriensis x Pyrus communis]